MERLDHILNSPEPLYVQLTRPNGSTVVFHRTGGQWQPISLGAVELEKTENGWRFTDHRGHSERYSSEGRLLAIEAPGRLPKLLSYDSEDRSLRSVLDPFGRGLHFEHQNGILYRVDSPSGTFHYGYDSQGRLDQVTGSDGTVRHYHYENPEYPSALTGITDENGNRFATWEYDDQGRAILSEHAGGASRTEFAYSDDSTTVTNPLGRQTTYRFQSIRGTRRVAQVEGHASTHCAAANREYAYTDEGWLQSRTDWEGNTTTFSYNSRGLETYRVEAAGTSAERVIQTDWHPDFRLPARVTEPERLLEYGYDAEGKRTSRTVTGRTTGEVRSWQYGYHPDIEGAHGLTIPGQLASVTDPRGNVTHYEYDTQGNLTRITNALGHVTEITEHDASGRPTRLVDPNGIATELTYNPRGRLERRVTAGAETHFSYDAVGNLTGVTLPDGTALSYEYDAAHRLVGIADAAGNRIDYTLDAAGNRIKEQRRGPTGQLRYTRQRAYDELSRLIRDFGVDGTATEYSYDANGNVISIVDPRHNATQQGFDALQRLVSQTDSHSGLTLYDYDAQDALTGVNDPRGNTTHYTSNAFGELIRQHSPDTGETTFERDAAGNMVRREDANGQLTEYSYDALSRLTGIHYPGRGEYDVELIYDEPDAAYGIGRLTTVNDAVGSVYYDYTPRGELHRVERTVQGTSYVIDYNYTAGDRLETLTYPSGRQVTYHYGDDGRVEQLSTLAPNGTHSMLAQNVEYLPFGPVRGFTYGNGLAHERQHNGQYALFAQSVSGVLLNQYVYDAAENVTGIVDLLNWQGNDGDQDFDYDALNRLTFARGDYGQLDYDYDAVHNRLARQDDDGYIVYTIDSVSNRLLAIENASAIPLDYDAAGNITAQGQRSYAHTPEHRLASVRDSGQLVARYHYDARALRRIKDTPSGTTHYVYDAHGRLLGEYAGDGTPQREYAYLNGQPIAVFDALGTYYIHTDHLGTPRTVTDAAGTAVWRWQSTPFGQGRPNEDANGDGEAFTLNLRFPGQYFDAETGLHYNWHRYYDPSTGRYITSDPIGLAGGLNTYGYASGNPLLRVDPTGLVDWTAERTGGGIFVVFGTAHHRFTMVSDCVDGQQVRARVVVQVSGLGGAVGATTLPLSIDQGMVFRDNRHVPDAQVFSGQAGVMSIGLEVAPLGWSYRQFNLGQARYVPGTGEGATGGIEIGGSVATGSSTVIHSENIACGCRN
ncbi:MAG: RHS repeat protein [Ectothiorhodospiraceae bacterium]|nr:RHS repeat protein [Ectothiorhodospiraceae bacterium]